ncbi:MAG: MerC domain-containing protein [Pseudomonadota bacterium]
MNSTTTPSTTRGDTAVDVYAVAGSLLCLAHCLALPALVGSLSAIAPFVESELAHKLLVLLLAPATVYAIAGDQAWSGRHFFVVAAVIGLSLLGAAAFFPPLEAHETPLTVLGSMLLSSAHLMRAIRKRR